MKKLITAICFFISFPVFGGMYLGSANISEYDQATGYYLKSVSVSEKSGFLKGNGRKVIDIFIYCPDEDKGAYIFKGKNKDEIVTVLYEAFLDEKAEKVVFNIGDRSNHIKNNTGIKQREFKDKILISTCNSELETYTLWVSDRHGNNLKKIKTIPKGAEWHIDVSNSKIRFIMQINQKINVESIDW